MTKVFSILFILIFLISSGFGFVYAFGMDHHSHQTPCPFMQSHTAICDMNFLKHFSLWKSNFSFVFFSMILVVFALAFYRFSAVFNFSKYRFYEFRKTFYVKNLYQQLFSEGILNPKAP